MTRLSQITVEGEVYVHKSEYDRLADALREIADDNDDVLHQFGDARAIARAALDRHTHKEETP